MEGRPWERVSWTMGTETEPVDCFRVEGVEEEGGMKRSSFDCIVRYSVEKYGLDGCAYHFR